MAHLDDAESNHVTRSWRASSHDRHRLAEAIRCHMGGLATAAGGWPVRPDADLGAAPEVSEERIRALKAALSPTRADQYVVESQRLAAGLLIQANRFSDLAFRYVQYVLSRVADDETLAIHEREVAAGWYTVSADIARHEAEAAATGARSAGAVVSALERTAARDEVSSFLDHPEKMAAQRAAAATVSFMSPYFATHWRLYNENPKHHEVMWKHDFLNASLHEPPRALENPPELNPGDVYSGSRLVYLTAGTAFAADASITGAHFVSSLLTAQGSSSSSTAIHAARQIHAAWAVADAGFRQLRTNLQYTLKDLRASALDDGASLALIDELRELHTQVREQLGDLIARAQLVSEALPQRYGVACASPPPHCGIDPLIQYLPRMASWLRDLDRKIARWQTGETVEMVTISLRAAVGETAWQEAIAGAPANKGAMALAFKLSVAEIGCHFPRVQGVSVVFVAPGAAASEYFRGSLSPPTLADATQSPIEQDAVTVKLGRIASIAAPYAADVVGTGALRNYCPIGAAVDLPTTRWHLVVAGNSVLGSPVAVLDDVLVQMIVVGVAS